MASKERACEYSRLSSLRRNAYLMEIYWYQPVHKADNKEVADNYRSISLLPFTAKWPGGGGGVVLGSMFQGMCLWPLSAPSPL